MTERHAPLSLCVAFGGPSAERNISCGSIKPWVMYLAESPDVNLTVLFFDVEQRGYVLPERFWFTNTCEDFALELSSEDALEAEKLAEVLRSMDLVIPLIHGAMGEDGAFQRQLDALGVRYLFSGPEALEQSLDKERCYRELEAAGLAAPRRMAVTEARWTDEPESVRADVAALVAGSGSARGGGLMVKPRCGGSSFGVSPVGAGLDELPEALRAAFRYGPSALIEEHLRGREFSTIVLEDDAGQPVALAPTLVLPRGRFFGHRDKYLLGTTKYETPYPADASGLDRIRESVVRAWRALGLRHLARIDGFVVPREGAEDEVYVTDVNGVSGFNFSSFVFQQSSHVGLSHAQLIERLILHALGPDRVAGGTLFPARRLPGGGLRVHLLLGGATSERQVSRQSGVFAGLCLISRGYDVRFFLMDLESRFTEVGLFLALHHDVDEIQRLVQSPERREEVSEQAVRIGADLGVKATLATRHLDVGETTDLPGAIAEADFVFLGLHGGVGENGAMQAALEEAGVPFNGPSAATSAVCADKSRCLDAIDAAGIEGVRVPRQIELDREQITDWSRARSPHRESRWERALAALQAPAVICKPASDGCSTGVKLLRSPGEMQAFFRAVVQMRAEIGAGELGPGSRVLKMPVPAPDRWLLEEALIDRAAVRLTPGWGSRELQSWLASKRFVELTCAVLEQQGGELHVTVPSITVAESDELSLEEKFQQGVGTNLSLDAYLEPGTVRSIQARVGAVAAALGIQGYSRVDLFYAQDQDEVLPIEVNTLCGLTEATVFYSQIQRALNLSPASALEHIVRVGVARLQALQADPESCATGSAGGATQETGSR